jgi:two-component system catabolic regulation response regulator CreB
VTPDRILIVEDEPAIAESLEYALRREGFATETAASFAKAQAARTWPTLILLDLMLPDGNGSHLIRTLRAEGRHTPIIVLSSREREADRVAALEDGADDYVTKPFSPREIVARVRAVLRRTRQSNDPLPHGAGLALDPLTRRAALNGHELELTRVEFDLLSQLCSSPGRVYTRSELIDRVWGDGFAISDRTVDSHVKSLRKKLILAGEPALIETIRGVGYRAAAERQGGSEVGPGPAAPGPAPADE